MDYGRVGVGPPPAGDCGGDPVVDSNVIIFTRIREEIEKGKSIRVAVDTGFKSALATVVDSQTTTLIAAIVLYLIGPHRLRDLR